ncbi:MAG: DUF3313 family protein [Xanthomonadales bacterium]|nr:DUF3313 family protein [Xanthomonadales bacterium]
MFAHRFTASDLAPVPEWVLALLLSASLPLLSLADENAELNAELAEDGLQLVEKDRHRSFYSNPNVDWRQYHQIHLLAATVDFRKNWQRDQNRSYPFKVRDEDVAELKQSMAELLAEVFSQELSKDSGYGLTDTIGKQVLTIRPAIQGLDISAPDTQNWAGIYRQYTESSGEMTLQLELLDSVTGEVLARSREHGEVPRWGYFQLTSSVTNQADARRMLRRWAIDLRERLGQESVNRESLSAPTPASAD